jgi:hypothetical protein
MMTPLSLRMGEVVHLTLRLVPERSTIRDWPEELQVAGPSRMHDIRSAGWPQSSSTRQQGILLRPAGKRLGSRIHEIDMAQSIGGDNSSGPGPEQASHPIVLPLDLRLQLVTLRNVEQAGADPRYLSGGVFDQGFVNFLPKDRCRPRGGTHV